MLLCAAAAAQGMYKCKDATGKITYSGKACHLMGLTDAGEVTGRASVVPAVKPPPPGRAPAAAKTAAAKTAAAKSAPPAEKSVAKVPTPPERRCFTVKTAKGTATRCNDKPEETPETK